jgi:hypothetical protein
MIATFSRFDVSFAWIQGKLDSMVNFLYNLIVSVRRYWCRLRSLRLYWICSVITDCKTGSKEYKYFSVWARNKSMAIAKTKLRLDRHYRSPYIRVECRAGYTRQDLS